MIGQSECDKQAINCQSHTHASLCNFQLRCSHTSWPLPCHLFKQKVFPHLWTQTKDVNIDFTKDVAKIKWHFFERKNLKMITSLSAEILDNYLSTCSRKCGIDALPPKHEVKMAGYWTSSFFAFLRTETEKRSIRTQKKKKKKERG